MSEVNYPEGTPAAPPAAPAPPAAGAPVAATNPGRTLGIVAFILAFFLQLFGLILGIVALVQSRNAGYKNPLAVWAIILSIVLPIIGIILAIVIGFGAVNALCDGQAPGVYETTTGSTVTCP